MDSITTITCEEFLKAANDFIIISNEIYDGWKLNREDDITKCYLKKEAFVENVNSEGGRYLLKFQYIIFYHLSYGVPAFSFNVWNSTGALLSLEEVRNLSCIKIQEKDFYSVITQQEHPILFSPFFIMHPCHTADLLSQFKDNTKNIIVTFLGLITPLIKLNLPFEYGL